MQLYSSVWLSQSGFPSQCHKNGMQRPDEHWNSSNLHCHFSGNKNEWPAAWNLSTYGVKRLHFLWLQTNWVHQHILLRSPSIKLNKGLFSGRWGAPCSQTDMTTLRVFIWHFVHVSIQRISALSIWNFRNVSTIYLRSFYSKLCECIYTIPLLLILRCEIPVLSLH